MSRPVLARAGDPLREQRDEQCPRVVVDAVAVATVGHVAGRVLEEPGVVGHPDQMVEPQLGQAALVRRSRRARNAASLNTRRASRTYASPTRRQIICRPNAYADRWARAIACSSARSCPTTVLSPSTSPKPNSRPRPPASSSFAYQYGVETTAAPDPIANP